jgi:hypothetical protein
MEYGCEGGYQSLLDFIKVHPNNLKGEMKILQNLRKVRSVPNVLLSPKINLNYQHLGLKIGTYQVCIRRKYAK